MSLFSEWSWPAVVRRVVDRAGLVLAMLQAAYMCWTLNRMQLYLSRRLGVDEANRLGYDY